jgi:hypothetical protein
VLHVLEEALETARKGPGLDDSDKLFTAFVPAFGGALPPAFYIPAIPLPIACARFRLVFEPSSDSFL